MPTIALTNSEQVATVDDLFYDDLLALGPWKLHAKGYVIMVCARHRPMHTAVMQLAGEEVTGIKYLSDDKLDNRLANLRPATHSQAHITRRPNRNSSTDFKGVSPHPGGKLQVGIKVNGERIYLGLFTDPIEAALAYDAAALKYFGDYAGLNFQ
jgi:hypothetical protein